MENAIAKVWEKAETLDNSNIQTACELWAAMQEAKRMLKEAEAFASEQMIAYIKENGEVQFSETEKLVAGVRKSNKQTKDYMAVLDAIFTAAQGDTQAVADCLAASPFKPASTQKLIGTDHVDKDGKPFFWKEETDKIEVKKIDKKYLEQN